MSIIEETDEMIAAVENWLQSQDYSFIECNYVPSRLFGKNPKFNALLRAFFRLSPYNFRNMTRPESGLYPLTPQCLVAMLKAFAISKNREVITKLYQRTLALRSPKSRNFALKQGIRIAINLYENSEEDPTPLNTVWFGQFLLDEQSRVIPEQEKKELLLSIAAYLTEELGYADHKEQGVYFYYGPTLKKEVYNASAIISAFLIRLGIKYSISEYIELGQRGIRYICGKQNKDGSWFYAGKPERPTVDSFHQSYILQTVCSVKDYLPFNIAEVIAKGTEFYKTLFIEERGYLRPMRYDKRYIPHNTWLFVKVDGRDVAEALVFFTKYAPDKEMVQKLLRYTYDKFYTKKKGYMVPEIFVYGKNRIPYIEFQAWFLYAFQIVKQYYNE
ncbi:hypothetical protein [Bacteroides fluxus]|uniref:hypothetical protein n=1 Tax=Bacteroides fluxus TaxID=626930 RepID=UPI00266B9788|nr:hypothetical protein [Bacteroides fluxus]